MSDSVLFPARGKVFLITTGKCDDFDVVGVASTPERAKEFMDQFPSEEFNKSREMFIDNLMKIPKGYPHFVRVNKNKICVIETHRCSIDIYHAELATGNKIDLDYWENLMVYVWAETSEEAERLALKRVLE